MKLIKVNDFLLLDSINKQNLDNIKLPKDNKTFDVSAVTVLDADFVVVNYYDYVNQKATAKVISRDGFLLIK